MSCKKNYSRVLYCWDCGCELHSRTHWVTDPPEFVVTAMEAAGSVLSKYYVKPRTSLHVVVQSARSCGDSLSIRDLQVSPSSSSVHESLSPPHRPVWIWISPWDMVITDAIKAAAPNISSLSSRNISGKVNSILATSLRHKRRGRGVSVRFFNH